MDSNQTNSIPGSLKTVVVSYEPERELAELRREIDDHRQRIAGLMAQVEAQRQRERDLREILLDAHDQLLRRDEDIALRQHAPNLPEPPRPGPASNAFATQTLPGKYLQYQQLLQRIRESVRDARVSGKILVISKGDEELLMLGPCKGLHFPQSPDGSYAGFYPANSAAAIEHLENLRERGAQFLLIPQTGLWWLDHYSEFGKFLNHRFSRVIDQSGICLLFDLATVRQSDAIDTSPAKVVVVPEPRPFGVNISGHLASEKGLGAAVRSQIRSFAAVNVPIALNDYPDDNAVNLEDEFSEFSENNPYSVNLIHVNADSLKYFVESKAPEYFKDHYNIGYWAWETPVFPRAWWDSFKYLDEIWVGSDFVLDAISRVSPIPVVKVLLAIPDRLLMDRLPRAHFGLPANAFIFLFVFDFMSIVQRKNPMGAVQAFRTAFGTREDVLLVLKGGHSERYPDEMNQLKQACAGANVRIFDTIFSRNEMTSLMAAADCYVSLHRSEGFGLTLAEAMSLEKPVIATGFSGNMDFTNPSNSYLVKYKLREIDEDYGPYRGGIWADPDVDHAAELMTYVFKNAAAARNTGRRARKDILKTLSEQRTGVLMRNRLLRIAATGKIAPPAVEFNDEAEHDPQRDSLYRQLLGRIHQAVGRVIPANSYVLVVSKGDEELVQFDSCTAWHFPQAKNGMYAGCHPADSKDAIQQLEVLKEKGARYLLFPQTAFWWLDYYNEFQSHLQTRYHRVWSDSDCVIYHLSHNTNLFQRILGRRQTNPS